MTIQHVAIGSDGTRPVVWGIGDTEAAAMADAADQEGCPRQDDLRLAVVTGECAGIIRSGNVDASDL
jgi:hypothetical protein